MGKKVKLLLGAAALVCAALLGVGCYLGDYYPAGETAVAAMAGGENVSVRTQGRLTAFVPREVSAGFIFYPGGKVEHRSYAPLLLELAEEGVLCVLVEMPGNLAVLDADAAAEVPAQFPEVSRWYIGGHSLGGSMAAAYAADHGETLAGLVLLAAYSTADLSGSVLPVLSLYGSEDGVLDMGKYEQYRSNLPRTAREAVLTGGDHGGFGDYGPQEGDGTPTLSREEQRRSTVEHLVTFFAE